MSREAIAAAALAIVDRDGFIDGMRNYFASLPPERFSNLVALAGPLTEGDLEGDDRFEFGLDVLL